MATPAPLQFPPPEPTTRLETITPSDAVRLLEHNKENRRLRIHDVRKYARDLAQGRWTLNNDAICITPSGRLINGQHRLEAIVEAGVPMTALVSRDMPDDTQHNMDGGARRTAADALHLTGNQYAHLLASTAKFGVLYTTGRIFRDNREQGVSTAMIREFVDENDDLHAAVEHASQLRSRIDAKPTVMALGVWLTNRLDLTESAEFWHKLSSRTDQHEGSPILALDDRLRRIRAGRIRTSQRDELFLICRAWNYWRKSQSVTSLQLPVNTAKNFPVPR